MTATVYVISIVYDNEIDAQFVGLTAADAMSKVNAHYQQRALEGDLPDTPLLTDWATIDAWAADVFDGELGVVALVHQV
jgi:hypothetical protein